MLHIVLANHQDEKKLKGICKKAPFAGLEADWKEAYEHYTAKCGDPWAVMPASFTAGDEANFRKLYTNRKGSGVLRRMRDEAHACCPMCGSGTTGSLDHYLPQEKFSEFAIFTKNLIPTCPHCNSSVKGSTYMGAQAGQRFMHPYFDTFANGPVWQVNVLAPFGAPEFLPVPVSSLTPLVHTMMSFHLDNVLGQQFFNQVGIRWVALPKMLRALRADTGPSDATELSILLKKLYDMEVEADTLNGWFPALYRGILNDPAVLTYMAGQL
jgi:hypothetical protein